LGVYSQLIAHWLMLLLVIWILKHANEQLFTLIQGYHGFQSKSVR
jgi:hypothetical protein